MSSDRFEAFARAAMLGLLAATSSCTSTPFEEADGTGGASNDPTGDGDGDGDADGDGDGDGDESMGGMTNGSGGSEGGLGGFGSIDAPGGAGGVGGSGATGVLLSMTIANMTLEEFSARCDADGGVVETHAHCGGLVTGPGYSYDSTIDVFTKHTCAGINTCTGFSCVIDD